MRRGHQPVRSASNFPELLIGSDDIGREFQGALACSASRFQRVETGGDPEVGPVDGLRDGVFSYQAPMDAGARLEPGWRMPSSAATKLGQESAL